MSKIKETAAFIQDKIDGKFDVGVVLGSGLGDFIDAIENKIEIPYEDIVHFPTSTAPGHSGKLIIGQLANKTILCLQGRFHYYEGYSMQEVTYPIRVMQELGIENLILTNAAGGLDKHLRPGDLMVIDDHINFMGDNPLIGKNMDEYGERFIDMSEPYDREFIKLAHEVSKDLDIDLKQGTYISYSGPSFETPAEIRLFGMFGGSAVGMSTVPEVIVANHGKQRVLCISCISNLGTGLSKETLSGQEVLEVVQTVSKKITKLVSNIIEKI